MTAVAFVAAAAVGAVIRWAALRWWTCDWQALLAVNAAGSAALGWLAANDVSDATVTVLGVGLAGSLTTFSSFALEVRRSSPGFATAYVALTVAVCLGAAGIGATL